MWVMCCALLPSPQWLWDTHACVEPDGDTVEQHHSDKMASDILDIRSNLNGAAAERLLGTSVGI